MKVKFNTLLEGSHYDTDAAKILVKAGLFDEGEARAIIKDLYENKIHAFVHADDLGTDIKKYLKGIARMCVDYANGDPNLAKGFLNDSIDTFDTYLNYVKEVRKKQDNPTKFDSDFMNKISYQEVKDFAEKYQKELDKKSKDELSKMEFDSSNYELVPINSYEEFHSKFGGRLTGDGSSDKAAGRGGTAWCHTNDESTYNNWINGGNKFFVLMNKDFKDIPFNEKTNKELVGKDDYGNSLIAILVDRYGNLKYATLRCNHERRIPNADNQYKTYAELSKVVGFNVEKKVQELGNFEESPLKDGVYYYDGKSIPDDLNELIEKVVIKDGVTKIGSYTFYGCTSLKSVTISNSVTRIGNNAFEGCKSLESVIISNSVISIGYSAFYGCISLKSIDIPNSVTRIGDSAFESCKLLESITIPDSVVFIGSDAFFYCTSLKSIDIPNSVTEIGRRAFQGCIDLTVKCNINSCAYKYCIDNNINFKVNKSNFDEDPLYIFLSKHLKDYLSEDNELILKPLGEFLDEEISYTYLQQLKNELDLDTLTLDDLADNTDIHDLFVNDIPSQHEKGFCKELLYNLRLVAKNEGNREMVNSLREIKPDDLIQILEGYGIIEGTYADIVSYYNALKDYFGY